MIPNTLLSFPFKIIGNSLLISHCDAECLIFRNRLLPALNQFFQAFKKTFCCILSTYFLAFLSGREPNKSLPTIHRENSILI